jgi:hypothetical protein
MLKIGNEALLLWLVRKKLKSLESISTDEVLHWLGLSNDTLAPKHLLMVFHKSMSVFYKEFFHDFLLKNVHFSMNFIIVV